MSEEFIEGLFTSLRELPRMPGRRGRSFRALPLSTAIFWAARYHEAVGTAELIERWMDEDFPTRKAANGKKVGRPEKCGVRAYLVAMTALTLSEQKISLTRVHEVLTGDLTERDRELLQLPPRRPGLPEMDYTVVTRIAAKVAATFDPRPFPSRCGLTEEERDRLNAKRDPEVMATKQRRADELTSLLLLGGWRMLPRDVRRRWKGDITLDGTVHPTWGQRRKRYTSSRTAETVSPEANAGWHVKERDGKKQVDFGYEAHLVLATSQRRLDDDFPRLVLGLSLDKPSTARGANAVAAVSAIRAAGLPAGLLVSDMGYTRLKPENYHLPMRRLGYGLLMQYDEDSTGLQGTHKGIQLVDGALYGPCLPDALKTIHEDLAEKRIDDDTFRRRLEQRAAYAVRPKHRGDGSVSVAHRCPAAGANATANCPLKQSPTGVDRGHRKALTLVLTTPSDPPPICSNSESVSVPAEFGARYRQEIAYGTDEWFDVYRRTRNEMEGRNQYLKDREHQSLADPGQRRFRGWAKQLLALVLKIVAANVQVVLSFIDRTEKAAGSPKPRGRRPKGKPDTQLPDATGPPIRIINTPQAA